jgi:hypothetical protein
MTPIKRRSWSCNPWPDVPSPEEEKNLGGCRKDACREQFPDLCVGNPVNIATGNKYEESLDLRISTPGIPLELIRAYNSRAGYEGPLGYGWTHNYDLSLEVAEETPSRRVIIWDGDG